jgi:hypothetical protein
MEPKAAGMETTYTAQSLLCRFLIFLNIA